MALMVAILMLITVSALAVSTMQTAASDGTVAGFQNQETMAFYAAEAAIAQARSVVREMGERTQLPKFPDDFPDSGTPAMVGTTTDSTTYAAYGGGGVVTSGGSNVAGSATGQPIYYADPDVTDPIQYVGEGKPCVDGCNMTIGGAKYNHTKWQINVVGQSPSGDQKRIEVVATRLLAVGY